MLIKAGLLIDGTAGPAQTDCYIAVDNGLITAIGRAGDFAAAQVAAAVDYSAYTVIPGLIDPHVHLFLEGIADIKSRSARWQEDKELMLIRAVSNLARSLKQGVTTVRDLGGPYGINLYIKKAVNQSIVPGPRVLTCRQAISITGGHFHYAGGREADGPDEIIKAVREQVKGGADCIKIMMTGCVNFVCQNAGAVELSPAEALEGVRQSLASGVTTLEHGALIDETTANLIAASGVYWVPTLVPFERMLEYGRNYQTRTLPVAGIEAVYERHKAMVLHAYQSGAKIVAGTDAGALGAGHGDMWREIALLVDCGLPPVAALRAATGLAAQAVGLAEEIGTLLPGKRADLLILAGNPLTDISCVRRVVAVLKDGIANAS